MNKQVQPLTPAALYARVSSDRQDVDLSVSAQLRALKEYAKANGYSIAREYVDEAESGRIADRPQFRNMIDEGGKATAPFQVILVWKFSRFTRKREHAVAFKSMLRKRGIRVTSITEHADDSPTGKLMEAIIESVDEFYSENLAQEVVRGMREAASRGFFLGSKAPFGYNRIKVSDGVKDRPTLEVDPVAAPIVKEIFESSRRGNGLMEICKELNGRGITNRGRRWQKNIVHYLLTNEAYTGTAVWGVKSKDEKAQEPVRVENAWPALVSRETFDLVQQGLHERAPTVQRPARVGSQYLLSGLLRCGVCGKPYSAQGAKSGQFAYYICGTLFREGAGTCSARYLNAPRLETFVVEKIRERILNEETIVALVTLVAEEIDAMAGELSGRLEVVEAELGDVRKRLEKLYEAIETSELTLEVLSPRIMSLRHREEQLEAAREDAETQLEQRRVELPDTEEIARYVADFRDFLKDGTIPERKALIRNFVEGIEVMGDEATLTYTVPMPSDGAMSESASVLDFVQSGPPNWNRTSGCQVTFCQSRSLSDISSTLEGHTPIK
jgi:DNA invertase Pin-like site-specific DNA recombinase